MRSSVAKVVVAALLVAAVSALSVASYAVEKPMIDVVRERGELRMGWGTWYPFCYHDPTTGEPTGMSIELAQDLATELGVQLVMVEDSWATLCAGLTAEKFDIWMNLVVTLPRALEMTFTNPIMLTSNGVIATAAWWDSHKDEIDDVMDLDDKKYTISVVLGSMTDMELTERFKEANITRFQGDSECVMALRAGRCDVYTVSMPAVATLVQEPDLVAIPGVYGDERPITFGLPRGDFISKEWVNHWIDQVSASGLVGELLDKYGLSRDMLVD